MSICWTVLAPKPLKYVSGVPLMKNSRVPADLVADELDDGETVDEIAYNHDLKPSDVLHLKLWREGQSEPALPR